MCVYFCQTNNVFMDISTHSIQNFTYYVFGWRSIDVFQYSLHQPTNQPNNQPLYKKRYMVIQPTFKCARSNELIRTLRAIHITSDACYVFVYDMKHFFLIEFDIRCSVLVFCLNCQHQFQRIGYTPWRHSLIKTNTIQIQIQLRLQF